MQVLIVDDQSSQRLILREIVSGMDAAITVTDFGDPVEALRWSHNVVPDLVILDYQMPKMDGLEFARRFRRPATHRNVKLMLVTCVQDRPLAQTALEAGISDVVYKPVVLSDLRARCRNLLLQRRQQQDNDARIIELEARVENLASSAERREGAMLEQLVHATCEREGRHVGLPQRVGRIAGMLAQAAGLPPAEVAQIEAAAWLHDVGNLALPEGILTKPASLSAGERGMMRKHTVLGYQLLKDSPQRRLAAVVALHHHECWDGTGYPDGLVGTAIPMAARVVAVASTLNALTAHRPDRPAWAVDRALAYVRDMGGVLFDPALAAAVDAQQSEFAQLLSDGAEAWSGTATPPQWTGVTLSFPAGRR